MMTLSILLEGIAPHPGFDVEITGITCDSRKVKPGNLFICIRGEIADGHNYASGALAKGAGAVVCERDLGLERQICVADTHEAYAQFCAAYFGYPSKKLKLIGVTGTNGKTTTAGLIRHILEHNGRKTGFVGTIGSMIGNKHVELERTTPDAFDLQKIFAQMVDEGCEYAVMEVSSHALEQKRVHGCRYHTAVFTNLTQDHLDYHKTMENYLLAKKKLFSMCGNAIINADDYYAGQMAEGLTCRVQIYSVRETAADFFAHDINFEPNGVRYSLVTPSGRDTVEYCTPGSISVYNSMAAIAACISCGLTVRQVCRGVSTATGTKGRLELVPLDKEFTIIIDYAHTPDGLEKLLSVVNGFAPGRIITVFGCGGNRDAAKRPIMGEIAARLSDVCIVTSDNPRHEDPMQIIADVLEGIVEPANTELIVEENRAQAIRKAIDIAQKDDIILLAGKGHETYQVIGDQIFPLDEREIIKDYFECRGELCSPADS